MAFSSDASTHLYGGTSVRQLVRLSVGPHTHTHAQTRSQNYRESGAAMAKDSGKDTNTPSNTYTHMYAKVPPFLPPLSLPIPSHRHPLPLAISKVEKTRFRAFGKNGLPTNGPTDEPTDGQTLI